MKIILSGGPKVAYTDYSTRAVPYWDEYYYLNDQSNAIYREWEELEYVGDDTILVGNRQVEFIGMYYNPVKNNWQTNPYIVNSNNTPRGGKDEPIIIGNGVVFTGNRDGTPSNNVVSFFDGIAQRANGGAKDKESQINPYLQEYTGTSNAERLKYLKGVLSFLEVEIKSVKTQLERDLRLLKNKSNAQDEKEVKIIQAAGLVLTSVGGLQIPGIILSSLGALGTLFNANNATKVTLTERVKYNTELLNKYYTDYKKFKAEYDLLSLTELSSDSGNATNKNTIYWAIGGAIALIAIIYFATRKS